MDKEVLSEALTGFIRGLVVNSVDVDLLDIHKYMVDKVAELGVVSYEMGNTVEEVFEFIWSRFMLVYNEYLERLQATFEDSRSTLEVSYEGRVFIIPSFEDYDLFSGSAFHRLDSD